MIGRKRAASEGNSGRYRKARKSVCAKGDALMLLIRSPDEPWTRAVLLWNEGTWGGDGLIRRCQEVGRHPSEREEEEGWQESRRAGAGEKGGGSKQAPWVLPAGSAGSVVDHAGRGKGEWPAVAAAQQEQPAQAPSGGPRRCDHWSRPTAPGSWPPRTRPDLERQLPQAPNLACRRKVRLPIETAHARHNFMSPGTVRIGEAGAMRAWRVPSRWAVEAGTRLLVSRFWCPQLSLSNHRHLTTTTVLHPGRGQLSTCSVMMISSELHYIPCFSCFPSSCRCFQGKVQQSELALGPADS